MEKPAINYSHKPFYKIVKSEIKKYEEINPSYKLKEDEEVLL
jgi:hypothetical protein|tara:strand:+ start:192 stop:317 length:126 start_codon:yes stop_codon:yes gene_type:complete